MKNIRQKKQVLSLMQKNLTKEKKWIIAFENDVFSGATKIISMRYTWLERGWDGFIRILS